ncbi:hypothetical protein ABZ319_23630 [Nocardia sp. NPDC005978]|uniref:hypothetical protein n=1 Tax=Nocardia sp. NPDC005978 TaxID=3156725 RepID=UPI0033B2FD48
MPDSTYTDPAIIVAISSSVVALVAAGVAGWQGSLARRSLKAAEASAEAAKLSAQTSAALAAIEQARFYRERRPVWDPYVERPTSSADLRLRLVLKSGDVDRVVVEFAGTPPLQFVTDQHHVEGRVIESRQKAEFGVVHESGSAYWSVSLPSSVGWVKMPLHVTSYLDGSTWSDVLRIEQSSILEAISRKTGHPAEHRRLLAHETNRAPDRVRRFRGSIMSMRITSACDG